MTQSNPAITNRADRAIIRSYVLGRSGVERVRITRAGNVEAYGTLPNASKTGWYFVGCDADVLREVREQAAR